MTAGRTIDEVAHETAASILPEMPQGVRAAVVIVSEITGKMGDQSTRTVWRFINCKEPRLQAIALRQIADLIEKHEGDKPG